MKTFTYILLGSIVFSLSSCDYINNLEYKYAITKGNVALKNADMLTAKNKFNEAYSINDQYFVAPYNSGITDYVAHNTDSSLLNYDQALSLINDDGIQSGIHHNSGNVYLDKVRQLADSTQPQADSTAALVKESLEKALEKYKLAINANVKNDSAQYNYIYTLNLLKQQEQNQQQNQDKNEENKDEEKQDKDDKEQDNKDNKQDNNSDDKKDNKEQQQNAKMDKNQALQDLKALENKEKKILEKLNLKKEQGTPAKTDKDW